MQTSLWSNRSFSPVESTELSELAIQPVQPPKHQLLKWIGSKHRFVREISSYLPAHYNTYIEPFLGGGAMLAGVAPNSGIAGDVYKPLFEIWHSLQSDPQMLVQWYESSLNLVKEIGKRDAYQIIRDSFNRNPSGKDLIFLSRAAYGGVMRFRKIDGAMSTPCGIHNPISVESFAKRVVEWHLRIKNTIILNQDYKDLFELAAPGDVIYCDPPYVDSQSILYGAQSFKFQELLERIQAVTSRGVFVMLSIDGKKKSGAVTTQLDLPRGLFKREIMIDCGPSMLRRFQQTGQKMENEHVQDRLLLTY